jgi:hypothetical protein
MEQEFHYQQNEKQEILNEKFEQFFTNFAHDKVAHEQFFPQADQTYPYKDITKLSYLFYGTNELHRKQRSLNEKIKNDTIYWTDDPYMAIDFLVRRIIEQTKTDNSSLRYRLKTNPDRYQSVLCIAEAPGILEDIRAKRREKKNEPLSTEEILRTTGTIEEGKNILLIKNSDDFARLIEFLVHSNPELEKYKKESEFELAHYLQKWQNLETLLETIRVSTNEQ